MGELPDDVCIKIEKNDIYIYIQNTIYLLNISAGSLCINYILFPFLVKSIV